MISIIVPVYKVEPYLRRCVDSILAQTYTDFELILVDDGSPDNCGAICDEYAAKDSRIRVIHQENGGLSAARNAGLDVAAGEYITFVDSDDLLLDTYLEMLFDTIHTKGADISVCDIIKFSNDEQLKIESDNQTSVATMSGRDACASIYKMDGIVPVMAWGKLYKRELFDGIRYPVGKIHEDDATTPKLLYNAKSVVLISNQLYLYRQREGSIMSEMFSTKRFDALYAVNSGIDFLTKIGDNELVRMAEKTKLVMQAKLIVRAYHAGKRDQIPEQYRISERKALRIIRSYVSDDTYSWFLSLNHPRLVRPYSYVVKIKQILGMKR